MSWFYQWYCCTLKTYEPRKAGLWVFRLLIERFSYDLEMKTREQNRHNKRTAEKTSCPKNCPKNFLDQSILRCNFEVILQHDWQIEQCLLHIRAFCEKLSKRLGLLRHISPYLKQRHKLTFYLPTIKPVMLYLSPIWPSCNKELLQRVLRCRRELHALYSINQ